MQITESNDKHTSLIKPNLIQVLKKQGYHWVGQHSAVKKCRWVHKSLVENKPCYKELFYGIKSHRCLQASPAVLNCLTMCRHCWRSMPIDYGITKNKSFDNKWDEPKYILEGLLKEHKRIICGYGSLVKQGKVDKQKYLESLEPTQVALSLSGEPTIYPWLGDLIHEFKNKGMTVFLVTSGVFPKSLERLLDGNKKPSQLYISVTAWNKKSYEYLNRPIKPNLWDCLLSSLELFSNSNCPTVMRITLIQGQNSCDDAIQGFSKLINQYQPNYVEVKGYMFIGYSVNRLKRENMPLNSEVKIFSKKLSYLTGYQEKGCNSASRVVLLARDNIRNNSVLI